LPFIVKEALAQAMRGDEQKLLAFMKEDSGAQEILNEAMDEGILGEGDVDSEELYVPYRP